MSLFPHAGAANVETSWPVSPALESTPSPSCAHTLVENVSQHSSIASTPHPAGLHSSPSAETRSGRSQHRTVMAVAEPIAPDLQEAIGRVGLPGWAYRSASLHAQEYEHIIRPSWQFVCHVSQVELPGSYVSFDLGLDPVMVIRGDDGVLRAFSNACRHRGFKLLEGEGRCQGRIACRYHGWSYHLDGALAKVPSPESFPRLNAAEHGLVTLPLEEIFGLIFVQVRPGGPSLAQQFEDWLPAIERWKPDEYVPSGAIAEEVWQCNWKIATDNNLENYHVPIGHPGYHRMLDSEATGRINAYGVSASQSVVRPRPSHHWTEAFYQRILDAHCAAGGLASIDAEARKQWYFLTCQPSTGINFYPEGMDVFQVLPLTETTCRVRSAAFIRRDATREVKALHALNLRINRQVSREDRFLCERVQATMGSSNWTPGPLSSIEGCIADFHARLRRGCPELDALQV